MQIATVQDLYELPETREQVSLLVSHDAPRMVASLGWFEATIASMGVGSAIEFGCGAGYLLSYLRYSLPDLFFAGVERQPNLAKLFTQDEKLALYRGDYRQLIHDKRFDLVVCDFGWDNHDIPISTKQHSTATIAGHEFCPNCSDDEVPFFASMLGAWKRWAHPEAPLAVAGRMTTLADVRAIVLAAGQHGWHLDVDRSTQLIVTNLLSQKERFPALVFTPTGVGSPLKAIEVFLQKHGW